MPIFYRNTFRLGRVKLFINKGLIENKTIVDYSKKSTDFPGMKEYEKISHRGHRAFLFSLCDVCDLCGKK